ncbi:drosulfakinin isoform X1 [Rhipicephalus microplus]|uniref:drosulfakinin isoform X1 n=1 Tax=Rhipicephalus microplus TaxID=6941 RepID=UPI003F6C6C36
MVTVTQLLQSRTIIALSVPPVSSTMQFSARFLLFVLVAIIAAASSALGYSASNQVSSQQQQQQQQRHRINVGRWLKSMLPAAAAAAASAGDTDSRNTADLDTADMIDPVLLASGFAKRQEDDYGHMRFGRSDDYGHMRFGRK